MTNLPTPYAAAKIAAFLAEQEHLSWTAYWDKQYGLWRVSQDDPDFDLYATSRDADPVIEYMATHSRAPSSGADALAIAKTTKVPSAGSQATANRGTVGSRNGP